MDGIRHASKPGNIQRLSGAVTLKHFMAQHPSLPAAEAAGTQRGLTIGVGLATLCLLAKPKKRRRFVNTDQLLALHDQQQRIEVEYRTMRREATPEVIRHVALKHGEGMVLYSRLNAANADRTSLR